MEKEVIRLKINILNLFQVKNISYLCAIQITFVMKQALNLKLKQFG